MAQAGPEWLHGHGGEVVGGVRLAEGAASSRADAFKSIAFTALPDWSFDQNTYFFIDRQAEQALFLTSYIHICLYKKH